MILITFALPEESADFRRTLANLQRIQTGPLPVYQSTESKVVVAHTGIGPDSVRRIIPPLLDKIRPSLVISSGYAGGLHPDLPHGALLVSRNFLRGRQELFQMLVQDHHWHEVDLHSADTPAATPAAKRELTMRTGADAVDMESGLLFEISSPLPFMVLRAVSDTARAEIPVPLEVVFDLERQRPRPFGLLAHLGRHPGRLPAFIRFVRGLKTPRRALADGLQHLLAAERGGPIPG